MPDSVCKNNEEKSLDSSTNQVDESSQREGGDRISKASYLFIITVFTTFLAEIAVMFFLSTLPALSVQVEAILDALLLSILIFPILYFLFYKAQGKQIEDKADNVRSSTVPKELHFANKRGSRISQAIHLLLVTVFAVFLAETTIMFFLSTLPPLSVQAEALLDSLLLSVLLFPILYFLFFKTLVKQIKEALRSENVLRQSEQKYRLLMETANDAIFLVDADTGMLVDANLSAQKMIGRPLDEIKRMRQSELHPPDDQKQSVEIFKDAINEGHGVVKDLYVLNREGNPVPVEVSASVIKIENKLLIQGVYRDVTERKRAEEELLKEHDLIEAMNNIQSRFIADAPAEEVFDGILNEILHLTQSEYGLIGEIFYTTEEEPYLKTHAITDVVKNEETRKFYDDYIKNGLEFYNVNTLFGKVISNGKALIANDPANDSRAGGLPDGHPPINSFLGIPLHQGYQIVGVVGIANRPGGYDNNLLDYLKPYLTTSANIISAYRGEVQRKKAEKNLQASREKFRTLVENQTDGIVIVDTDENITFANPAANSIFGVDDGKLIGRNLREFLDKNQIAIIADQTALRLKNVTSSYEIELITEDSEKRFLQVTATPLFEHDESVRNILGVFRDVTDKRRVEDELAKKEKLESIGLLAGGIAHDFNNFLTAILGNITMIKSEFGEAEDSYRILEDAEKATLQAQNLTRQLLTFSKGGIPMKEASSIAETLSETIRFTLSGSNVRCESELPDNLKPVKFDKGQIGQAIQNIIINARQAMPEGGIIRLAAENIVIDEKFALPVSVGEYVKISVKDDGPGISEENKKRIFDPFFTTKEKGSGLGLTTAYSIIKKHDGFTDVVSSPGSGTTFMIFLPVTEEIPVPLIEESESESAGFGKILVVDDEKFIRDMLQKILTKSGYDVYCAPEGSKAVEMYKNSLENKSPFDLVVIDLTIPGGMGGKETMINLHEINPEVKAIVSSGYSNDPIMAEYEKFGFAGRVEKPYKAREIKKVIKSVLSSPLPSTVAEKTNNW